jgi:hypothetical protein
MPAHELNHDSEGRFPDGVGVTVLISRTASAAVDPTTEDFADAS